MHPCEDIFCSFHCPCSYGVFSIDLVQQKSLWSTRSLEFPCRVLLFTFFVYLVSRRYWNVKALELPLSKCFSMGKFCFLNRFKKALRIYFLRMAILYFKKTCDRYALSGALLPCPCSGTFIRNYLCMASLCV